MKTVTRHRTSLAWVISHVLTPEAREHLAEVLDCVFTDENTPREVMPIAHDVTLVVIPGPDRFSIVAHFDSGSADLPSTREDWLSSWVERACERAALPPPGAPTPVLVGT